jgi:class 3 adenylate cyclase
MLLLRHLSLQSKLILLLLVVNILSMLIIAYIGYASGRDGLEKSAADRLAGLREARADQLHTQLKFIRNQVTTLSEDRMVVDAMREFLAAYRKLDAQPIKPEWDKGLADFYRNDYLPALAKKVDTGPVLEAYLPTPAAARYLQYHYLAANPAAYFEKDQLDDPGDGSEYSALHKKYHPLFRNIAHSFGYEDLMLVDPESGDIVYTAQKTTEFATNLLTGPYAGSNLGELFKVMRKIKDPKARKFARHEPYRPNLAKPAAFTASPISDGPQVAGILVFQFPIDSINRILAGDLNWQRDGLGQSGEVYAVGADHLMRSLSRFYQEDPEGYLDTLQKAGYSAEQVERIRRAGTTILNQEIRTSPVEKALAGQSGVEVHTDYRGRQALSAYAPFELEGSRWAIVAKLDLAEADAPTHCFRRLVAVTAAIITLVVSLCAVFLSSLVVRPIYRLIDGARRASAGQSDVQVDVGSHDEFRELADTFNEMMRNLKSKSEQLEQKARENEELLLHILPDSAIARHKLGEQIIDSHADVTVLFADVAGFNELAQTVPPEQAIGLLNELIVAFDEAAQRHGVEKVKTVGTSYVAVCNLSQQRSDHSRRMVAFARDLLRIVKRFDQEREAALAVQISINAGPVLGGVVGRTRILYDLWGDTVTVARRLHSGGESNTIRVTRAVRDRVADLETFAGPQTVEVPGMGSVPVWSLSASPSCVAPTAAA